MISNNVSPILLMIYSTSLVKKKLRDRLHAKKRPCMTSSRSQINTEIQLHPASQELWRNVFRDEYIQDSDQEGEGS